MLNPNDCAAASSNLHIRYVGSLFFLNARRSIPLGIRQRGIEMSTFYLLPPRACLEQASSDLLGKFLPGLPLPVDAWDIITAQLASAANWSDVFFVPRDELPEGDVGEALAEAYGAEPGDRVVEVSLARPAKVWTLPTGVYGEIAAR